MNADAILKFDFDSFENATIAIRNYHELYKPYMEKLTELHKKMLFHYEDFRRANIIRELADEMTAKPMNWMFNTNGE